VEGDVVGDEAGHEEVGVVVAGLHPEGDLLAGGVGGGLEQLGLQLLGQEAVGVALVDQDVVIDSRAPRRR
jgi:hypothetical protein